jgi:hypothetical protein
MLPMWVLEFRGQGRSHGLKFFGFSSWRRPNSFHSVSDDPSRPADDIDPN